MTQLKTITPRDVLALRKTVYHSDGTVSSEEIERLFQIDEAAAPDSCPEWTAFFVEAGVDYLVHQVEPRGYISKVNANWLLDRITRDGKVRGRTELELLVKALETARSAPARLTTFALEQVSDAVLNGEGPLAGGGEFVPGVINREEVELVRRIIHSMAGASNIGISQEEADILFNMNDKSVHGQNDLSWNELFVKALANYVVGNARPTAPFAEEQLRWEAALMDDSSFVSRAVSGAGHAWSDFLDHPRAVFGKRQPSEAELRNQVYEAQTKAAETVTSTEARWLADRINKDGDLHRNEQDLLKFIKELAPAVDKSLEPLIKRVA